MIFSVRPAAQLWTASLLRLPPSNSRPCLQYKVSARGVSNWNLSFINSLTSSIFTVDIAKSRTKWKEQAQKWPQAEHSPGLARLSSSNFKPCWSSTSINQIQPQSTLPEMLIVFILNLMVHDKTRSLRWQIFSLCLTIGLQTDREDFQWNMMCSKNKGKGTGTWRGREQITHTHNNHGIFLQFMAQLSLSGSSLTWLIQLI